MHFTHPCEIVSHSEYRPTTNHIVGIGGVYALRPWSKIPLPLSLSPTLLFAPVTLAPPLSFLSVPVPKGRNPVIPYSHPPFPLLAPVSRQGSGVYPRENFLKS